MFFDLECPRRPRLQNWANPTAVQDAGSESGEDIDLTAGHYKYSDERVLLVRAAEVGEILFQAGELWQVVHHYIGTTGVILHVVLVVGFGGIKGLEFLNFCDDGARVDSG